MDEEVAAWPFKMDERYDLMQNHTENHSGTEKTIHKGSLSRSSVQEIGQERGAISIYRREEAMALKSSRGAAKCLGHIVGDNTDSAVGFNDYFAGEYDGLQSARKFQGDDIVIEQSSNMDVVGTVMSLSRSTDPDTQSDSLQSFEEYEGPLCGAESPAVATEPGLGDGREMFCVDEVGNDIIEQNAHMGADLDSKVGEGNSFPEIDPIPIPGPPGSFLPSPGDMGSEDFQGNSSLTTSRVHSSQDQHDFLDGDSSDSPISATSSVSNSTAARSDLKYSEKLLSVGPRAVQDKIRSGFSGTIIEPVVENAAAVMQTANMGADRVIFGKEGLKVNVISSEKGSIKFKDDDQPCCCSRKERVSHGVALNYQESQLLRRRTMASMTLPAMGKQMGCNTNTRPNNLNTRPEIFSLSNCPSSGSEKVVLPVMKSTAGPIAAKGSSDAAPAGLVAAKISSDAAVKFPIRCDSDSASPSASNAILRLMGKNLMVMNKDEDSSLHLREAQPGASDNCPNAPLLNISRVSPGNIQNQDYHSFHHIVSPQGCVNFGQDSHIAVGQCFDVRLSNGFRSQVNSLTPETPTQGQSGILPHMCSGLAASMELREYKSEYNLQTQPTPKNRLDASSTYNIEKVIRTPDPKCRNADSAANPIKEIIIIDDAPESEADSTIDDAKYTKGLRRNQVFSAGISIIAAPDYSSSHVNPYSCYQTQDPSPLGELQMVQNTSFHAPHTKRANTSPFKWSCTSDGSGVLQRGPLLASSSSASHLRSALYYSPSLS
ncbi:hypothetical protein L1049_001519 [Liquidambar formosana]|uniref:Uncharacterized protein n=1 Tax=Liquidambar formosana TaxID=63359 RepID=A0AAP0NCJ3_LIQFO